MEIKTIASVLAVACGLMSTGSYGGNFSPSMTPQQEAALSNSFVRASDIQVAKAITEAQPLIIEITKRIACYPKYDGWRILGSYTTPDYSSGGWQSPMTQVDYHPKSQCLSVVRIDGWKMPALNALEYRVAYTSDQSSHSVSRKYRLIKQIDGQWLLDNGL